MSKEILSASAVEIGQRIAVQELSPVEVTEALMDRSHSLNESVNAYISFRDEKALDEARTAEREIMDGRHRGPLHGVPMAIKDNVYLAGEVTTMGSKIHQHFTPEIDATVATRMKSAGIVLSGKLNMHEYAWGGESDNPHYGAVHNPWDLDRIPGGSSGGSGAAVAADMSFGSIGTDTAGSVRIPASACGIVGLKPTHGLVPKDGAFPLSWSLDHIGPVSKTVEDAAALLDVLAGFEASDPTAVRAPQASYLDNLTRDPSTLVIGVEESYFFHNIDTRVEKAVRAVLDELVSQGATLKPVKIPSLAAAEWTEMATLMAESSAIHHANLTSRPGDFGDDVRLMLRVGELFSGVELVQAQQARRQLKTEFTAALNEVDVIITPTLPIVPAKIGESFIDLNGTEVPQSPNLIRLTGPSNLTGLPALSVPGGFAGGMPVGVQVIGRAFDEAGVLQVGKLIEALDPLKGQRPSISTEG